MVNPHSFAYVPPAPLTVGGEGTILPMRAALWSFILALSAQAGRPSGTPPHESRQGISILGSVVDARGFRLSGVQLRVRSSSGAGPAWEKTRLVVGSGFQIDGIPGGVLALQGTRDGYLPGELELGAVEPEDVVFDARLVLRGAGALEGRALDRDGTPLEGADVWLEEDQGGFARATSDAQGCFRLVELGPAPWSLWAAHGAERDLLLAHAPLADGSAALELTLAPPGALEVLAPNALVLAAFPAFDLEDFPWAYGESERASTRWSRLVPGDYWIEALDVEHALGAWQEVRILSGENAAWTPTLGPVTRVLVRTFEAAHGPGDARRILAPARLDVRAAAGWKRTELPSCFAAEAEHELWLPPGDFELEARRELTRATVAFRLEAGEATRSIELVLQ